MAGLTVSAFIEWPHEYIFLIPQSVVLSMPTYLLPYSSDRRPEFSAHLGGGGGWCLNHVPLAHRRLRRCYRLLHPSDHPVHHGISRRSRGDAPLIFFDRDPDPVPVSPM